MKRRWILTATWALLLVLILAACGQSAPNTPDQAVRTWLDAWVKMDLDSLLKLVAPPYQSQAKTFYTHEFSMYNKISYHDLSLSVLSEGGQEAKVQADFQVELEAPSTSPGLAATVTRNAVRHVFTLIKVNTAWLVSNIERNPL